MWLGVRGGVSYAQLDRLEAQEGEEALGYLECQAA